MRNATLRLLKKLDEEHLPFRLFEGFRGPARQAWLYAQGRPSGTIVTYAKPWESYHQYGLAADFVLWINDKWSWACDGAHAFYWDKLAEIGKNCGLEPLKFERPHLQVAKLDIKDLRAGKFPDGGDDAWRDNLEATALSWKEKPDAPLIASQRPALPKK